MSEPYDDIIGLPHHVSTKHPQMSIGNRAAQFSPFAALTGHDDAVKETARLTDERIELGESMIAELDIKLHILADAIADQPGVSVTYFRPDDKKTGGAYVTAAGALKKIDEYERALVFVDGRKIPIADVLDMECKLFKSLM